VWTTPEYGTIVVLTACRTVTVRQSVQAIPLGTRASRGEVLLWFQ